MNLPRLREPVSTLKVKAGKLNLRLIGIVGCNNWDTLWRFWDVSVVGTELMESLKLRMVAVRSKLQQPW